MTTAKPLDPAPGLGAVYTKAWVVEMMLDLADYTDDQDLAAGTVIEPAVGSGAFLVAIIGRLLSSCRTHGHMISTTGPAIRAFDVDQAAVRRSRRRAVDELISNGVKKTLAQQLSIQWIRQGDFLVEASGLAGVRWVIGNPPYVRVEDIDRPRLMQYRRQWSAMKGRADLYIGFLQAGLSVLAEEGTMTTICADRWMRNQYGTVLRELITDGYAVDAYVPMHGASAFETSVATYPAVTRIRRGSQCPALVLNRDEPLKEAEAADLIDAWQKGSAHTQQSLGRGRTALAWTTGWHSGPAGWPSSPTTQLAHIESRLPTLAEAGIVVSVGPATGADKIYITGQPLGVEQDRLIPAVGAHEVRSGQLDWTGRYLVNPWESQGLVELEQYPGLARYLQRHRQQLLDRHVARARPDQWWRTIDRVKPETASTPKLLVPDIKDRIFPVLDQGMFIPMHNLYYITAKNWDLRVLGGLLMSDIATQFVTTYSVRMASGYFRVSAQYLRRVHVPEYTSIPTRLRRILRKAFDERDLTTANQAARLAYGLKP